MDPVKIGYFIRECRKEKGYTQEALADKIYVSHKTVSKWETGNGTPDVSVMSLLCKELDINLNELFSGKRLDDQNYRINAEKNLKLMIDYERETNKKLLIAEILIGIAIVAASLALIMLGGLLTLEVWQRVLFIGGGLLVLILGVIGLCILEVQGGFFQCQQCGEVFRPTFGAYLMGMHTITRRHLKCPSCGKWSMAKRRLSKGTSHDHDHK